MSGHKPWSEISEKLRADPERRARIEQRERAIAAQLTISRAGCASQMSKVDLGPYPTKHE